MKLGLVTYQLTKDWDLDRIIETCSAHGFEGVELRTTHAHGVEVALGAEERREVRRKFRDGLVDLGAPGVKVRPNALVEGVPEETTLRQIGECLAEVGEDAASVGVEIRVETHGPGTSEPARMKRIMDCADHPNVFICWNCNHVDVVGGSIQDNFELLADRIRVVHMHELCSKDYPWLDLFRLLRLRGFGGYCLAEIPESDQPARLMDYYRSLWEAYQRVLDLEGVPR